MLLHDIPKERVAISRDLEESIRGILFAVPSIVKFVKIVPSENAVYYQREDGSWHLIIGEYNTIHYPDFYWLNIYNENVTECDAIDLQDKIVWG